MSHITHKREGQARNLLESIILGVVLTTLSYGVGIAAGWTSFATLNWLEVFAVATSYASTYLCVKQRRINYPIGALSTAAYALLFFQSNLLLSAILNLYLVPTLVYGWYRWRKDSATRPVARVKAKMIPVYALITIAGYAGAAAISQRLGGAMAWTDAIVLAGTILAQFLLDNKKLENWFVWAIVNIFAIYTYATAGLALAALQYVFFLGNTIYGYISWKRSMNHENSLPIDDSNAANDGALELNTVR